MILVVTLTVHVSMVEQFRAYERQAARIMAAHGGAIERSVVISAKNGSDVLQEIHLVRFPDEHSLAGYRADPGLAAIAHLREEAIARTEVMVGEEGPNYGTAP